ncbi:Peroxisomal membrane protein PMP27 [Fusarium oxysporum f. sp. albedinis]|nr:Peroxisomal membrane protein PMP27 [Fusarium oxysporum f. sp. albedinis]
MPYCFDVRLSSWLAFALPSVVSSTSCECQSRLLCPRRSSLPILHTVNHFLVELRPHSDNEKFLSWP